MGGFFNQLISFLKVLVMSAFFVFLVLAILEPIYTTPWREWIPLLVACLSIGLIWTFISIHSGSVEGRLNEVLPALIMRVVGVTLFAFIAVIFLSFFGWNGGAPLDDVNQINPADVEFP